MARQDGDALHMAIFHVLAGGVMLGAFFMATDYVTTPLLPGGKVVFGIGCGRDYDDDQTVGSVSGRRFLLHPDHELPDTAHRQLLPEENVWRCEEK